MSQLDKVTSKICSKIKDKHVGNATQVMVDPVTMLMVAKIIIELVRLIKKCRTEEDTIESVKSPTIFERRVVYRVIKKRLTWRQYFARRQKISDAIFKVGSDMSEDDMFELFEEV